MAQCCLVSGSKEFSQVQAWPEHVDYQRFHVARRQIDQQPQKLSIRNRLQMITDHLDMPAPDEGSRFDRVPRLTTELEQTHLTTPATIHQPHARQQGFALLNFAF
jgi:hypothetical protein